MYCVHITCVIVTISIFQMHWLWSMLTLASWQLLSHDSVSLCAMSDWLFIMNPNRELMSRSPWINVQINWLFLINPSCELMSRSLWINDQINWLFLMNPSRELMSKFQRSRRECHMSDISRKYKGHISLSHQMFLPIDSCLSLYLLKRILLFYTVYHLSTFSMCMCFYFVSPVIWCPIWFYCRLICQL